MLDNNLKTQLKAYLEKVTQPIEITASLDTSEKSHEMSSLLNDIANLSDKITLTERRNAGDGERVPSFGVNRAGAGGRAELRSPASETMEARSGGIDPVGP